MSRSILTGRLVPLAILLIHCSLLMHNAIWLSPTLCEPGHLAAGVSCWYVGRFELYHVNPPLVRATAAIPVVLMKPATKWDNFDPYPTARSETIVGIDFFSANGKRSFLLLTVARVACIPFSILGACICFQWADALYGRASALIAIILWCFCPTVLANGALITPDVGGAAIGCAASFLFWQWLRRPELRTALFSGIVLGLAILSKFTLVICYPLWPVLWIFYRSTALRKLSIRDKAYELGQFVACLAISVYVVNAGYLFQGSGQQLGKYQFQSRALSGVDPSRSKEEAGNRFTNSFVGHLPVPLPREFVQGVDKQKVDFEKRLSAYWGGQWHPTGTWFYYLYGFIVKTPVGTLVMFGMAVCATMLNRGPSSRWKDECVVMAPAIVISLLVSSQTGLNSNYRYILPSLPCLYIWISKTGQGFLVPNVGKQNGSSIRVPFVVGHVALAWSVVSSLAVYPHSLSYFNEIAGGPAATPPALLDSNIAWGQDLHFAKRWMDQHPEARPLQLAAFTLVDPRLLGIEFSVPPQGPPAGTNLAEAYEGTKLGPQPGWYAIDVNFLEQANRYMPDGKGGFVPSNTDCGLDYSYFRRFEPIGRAGYSIYFYHLTPESVNRVRRDLGMASLDAGPVSLTRRAANSLGRQRGG